MKIVVTTVDYWAWAVAAPGRKAKTLNAIAIAIVEIAVGEDGAKEHVRRLAVEAEHNFDMRTDYLAQRSCVSPEVQIDLDAVRMFAAGNSFWCATRGETND